MNVAWRVLALSIAGLGLGRARSRPALCHPPHVRTDAWPLDSGSAFRVRVIPGSRREPMQGIDSEIGGWKSPSVRLMYDYGAYSDPLRDSLSRSGVVCDQEIGDRRARLVSFHDSTGHYRVGAHWPNVRGSSIGPLSLTITGVARDAAARDSLVAIMWSVRFR